MWAVLIEVSRPCRDQIAGMAQVVEQVLVQTLIPHPAVEACHKTVLPGLSGRNVMPINLAVFLPQSLRAKRLQIQGHLKSILMSGTFA